MYSFLALLVYAKDHQALGKLPLHKTWLSLPEVSNSQTYATTDLHCLDNILYNIYFGILIFANLEISIGLILWLWHIQMPNCQFENWSKAHYLYESPLWVTNSYMAHEHQLIKLPIGSKYRYYQLKMWTSGKIYGSHT